MCAEYIIMTAGDDSVYGECVGAKVRGGQVREERPGVV